MDALAETQGLSLDLRERAVRKYVPENTETVVKVYCRLRPQAIRSMGTLFMTEDQLIRKESNSVQVLHNGSLKSFDFTSVLPESSTQQDIYEHIGKPLFSDALYKGRFFMTRQERASLYIWS